MVEEIPSRVAIALSLDPALWQNACEVAVRTKCFDHPRKETVSRLDPAAFCSGILPGRIADYDRRSVHLRRFQRKQIFGFNMPTIANRKCGEQERKLRDLCCAVILIKAS